MGNSNSSSSNPVQEGGGSSNPPQTKEPAQQPAIPVGTAEAAEAVTAAPAEQLHLDHPRTALSDFPPVSGSDSEDSVIW